MSDIVESQDGRRVPRPGRRTTWVVVAVLVVGLVVLLPAAWHWWTHPDRLPDHTGTRTFFRSQPVDEAAMAFVLLSPTASRDPVTVTWHGATAVFAQNTSRTTVAYSLCDTVSSLEGLPTSFADTSLTQVCSAQRPLTDGMHVTYPDRHQLVLVTLTPTRPGVAHLTGVDVRYSLGADHLFQHGTDLAGLNARLVTR